MTEEIKEETQATEKPKKGKKMNLSRRKITVGVIIIVIVVAAIGMFAWHNTASFCGTVCHGTMSNYSDGYSNDTTTLAYARGHIDDDYTLDADGMLVIEDGHYSATKEFCTQCHDYEKVIAATANYNGGKHDSKSGIFNPHASHQGDLECGTCHNMHGTSTMYCTSCHNAEVPEGWQTVAEAMAK